MANDWSFIAALPNLSSQRSNRPSPYWSDVGSDLGSDTFALVDGTHEIVSDLMQRRPAVAQILSSFRDEFGRSYIPSVVLARESAPLRLRTNASAFNDFRNAIAMSCVLRGRARAASGNGQFDASWSDTFDFHPAQLNARDGVVLQSPALLNAVHEDSALALGGSPSLSLFSDTLHPDGYLYRCIAREWRRRYLRPARNDAYSRSLFRALEVAYHASSVGTKSLGSAVEYGTQIGSWVSAIEILAWPSNRRANLGFVFGLFDAVNVSQALSRRRYKVVQDKRAYRVGALKSCYWKLYQARNKFLHGEPVSFSTLLAHSRDEKFALTRVAAILFRHALVAYLSRRYPHDVKLM